MVLYKYAGDSGFKILETLRLKIAPPNEFNDPFEITPNSKRARPLAEMVAAVGKDSKFFRGVYDDMVSDGAYVGTFDQFIKVMPAAIPKHYVPYKKLSKTEMIKRDLAALDDVSLQLSEWGSIPEARHRRIRPPRPEGGRGRFRPCQAFCGVERPHHSRSEGCLCNGKGLVRAGGQDFRSGHRLCRASGRRLPQQRGKQALVLFRFGKKLIGAEHGFTPHWRQTSPGGISRRRFPR
jgi:hypothetical protein